MKTEKLFTMSKKELVELAKAHKIPGRSLAEKSQGTDALISLICLYMEANNISEIGVADDEVEGTTEVTEGTTKRDNHDMKVNFYRGRTVYLLDDKGGLVRGFRKGSDVVVNIPRNVVDADEYIKRLQYAVLYCRHIATVESIENLQKSLDKKQTSDSVTRDQIEDLKARLERAKFENKIIEEAYGKDVWTAPADDLAYLHAVVMCNGTLNLKGVKDIQNNLLDLFKRFTSTLEKSILEPEVCNNIQEAKICLDLVRGEFEKYFDVDCGIYKRYKWNIKNSDLITLYRESGYIDATGECGEKFKDAKVLTKKLAYFILARLGAWTAPTEK